MPYVDNEWIRNENNLNLLKSGKLIIKSANYAEKISSLTSSTRRRLLFWITNNHRQQRENCKFFALSVYLEQS